MNFVLQPLHLLVVILAGWFNRHQQAVIEFQSTQILVLPMFDRQAPQQTHPPEQQSAAGFGRQRQDLRTKGLAGNNHDRHSRYHFALASPTGS